MSTPSKPPCIGMINICIQINCDITLNPDNSHLASWIILWHNQHSIFAYLPNHQNTIGSLPGTLSKMLIPFLGAPQTFMHCGPARNLWANSPPGSTFNARHIITNKFVSSFKSLLTNTPLGGLLADDMGLGKIIQDIVLIGTSKERLITNAHCYTPTIIICTPCLITNWKSEISKHAQAGALQAKIYHGPTHHSLCEANILKCDIIITSYNTTTQEFKQTHTCTSFIFKINWHCIILDEAHYVFSQYTATHHAINSLLSSRRICLTGTPIHNTIYDLLGIISFITQPQSSDQDNWSQFILSSLSKGSNDIWHLALQHLNLCCTKTTHLKSLPTISHHYELLPLNPTMQQEYSTLYNEFLSSNSKGPGDFF
ncbi:hypothetical protein O181_015260 [Austropuccinia psidii MF-1]|uniref:Helicase ATP-binding domain-containing protein n=1 Tax=Austropuccinia psidii MF-1 TaxID=1389203 RepID=A0A9Q3C3K0_9BASI|nr:hypothetical protein [Austropuccinia psidii MF-1]